MQSAWLVCSTERMNCGYTLGIHSFRPPHAPPVRPAVPVMCTAGEEPLGYKQGPSALRATRCHTTARLQTCHGTTRPLLVVVQAEKHAGHCEVAFDQPGQVGQNAVLIISQTFLMTMVPYHELSWYEFKVCPTDGHRHCH